MCQLAVQQNTARAGLHVARRALERTRPELKQRPSCACSVAVKHSPSPAHCGPHASVGGIRHTAAMRSLACSFLHLPPPPPPTSMASNTTTTPPSVFTLPPVPIWILHFWRLANIQSTAHAHLETGHWKNNPFQGFFYAPFSAASPGEKLFYTDGSRMCKAFVYRGPLDVREVIKGW